MADLVTLDAQFQAAVTAIDEGDVSGLEHLLASHSPLVTDRLESPGAWLRDQVGRALDGFFARPFLLWFVAEDPVRRSTLPANIAVIARLIIDAARREAASSLQEQLDYTLRLVSWSWIARECGVQIALIDVLLDAGASPDGNPNAALVNGNFEAAEHLVRRGAPLTLAAALCLGRWTDADRLLQTANDGQKQFGFVLAALNGKGEALRYMIRAGANVNRPSEVLYSHGTPLHHAVSSGSLEAVQVLVEAGADLGATDLAWHGTPLGWAKHYIGDAKEKDIAKAYPDIAAYLLAKERQE